MENELIRKLAGAIEEQTKKAKSKSYDTQATVKRVEGETVWVHIPGGVDETPVSKTIACSAGDTVQVRVTNGRGFIVGNGTAPPTDDTTAIISKEIATEARYTAETALEDAVTAHDAAISATESAATAGRAASVAQAAADAAQETANSKKTVFVTEPTPPYHVGDLWVRFDPEVFDMVDSDGNSLIDDQGDLFEAAILKEAAAYVCMVPKLAGQAFDESDFELATADNGLREWFWHDANGAHILGDVTGFRNDLTSTGMSIVDTSTETSVAQFGGSGARIGRAGGAHSIIDSNGQRFYDGVTQLANIGYGEGIADDEGSTAIAPYYSFGLREGNTASFIGNYSVAEGYGVLAKGYCSHAEGYGSNDPTTAEGYVSHAEGFQTWAEGEMSHAEGNRTHAKGHMSHAQGNGTTAYNPYETVIGTVNEQETVSSINPYKKGDFAFVIGNGTYATPSNAFTVSWDGDVDTAGDITDGSGNVLSDKADATDIPTATSELTNDSNFVTLTSSKPLFKKVSVQKTFNVSANSTANQSFSPASSDVPSGYTRVGLCGWNTANGNVFIVTCTGTTITFGNKSSSQVTCNNAQVDWLYIRSSI